MKTVTLKNNQLVVTKWNFLRIYDFYLLPSKILTFIGRKKLIRLPVVSDESENE
jgi:hypothetical protein